MERDEVKDYNEIFELAAELSERHPKSGKPIINPRIASSRYEALMHEYISNRKYNYHKVCALFEQAESEVTEIRAQINNLSTETAMRFQSLHSEMVELFIASLSISEDSAKPFISAEEAIGETLDCIKEYVDSYGMSVEQILYMLELARNDAYEVMAKDSEE